MKYFLPQISISKFLFSTPKPHLPCFHILHFSTTPPATPSYPSRRHEEESRNVRVSVWWDFENCSLPTNVNVFKVAQFITASVRANGIKGPVTITAFGDVVQLSRPNQEALSATGINLTHIPNGGKNSADRSLLVDLLYWVSQNPPPAHLFLISGDRDFASVLHRLRMNNYNILLASSDSAPGVLCSAASIKWLWSSLVRGENLTGRYFNQPPDGPYASLYGDYKAPLEDPFAVVRQPSYVRVDEVTVCGQDMLRPIPKIVMKQIRNILNSYPKGVSAVDLRAELDKSNVSIDKDFFGYRKFSRFLLAMPQILKIKQETNGQYLVHSIPTKNNGENDSNTRSSVGPLATKDEGRRSSNAAKQNGEKTTSKESADIKPLQCSVSELKVNSALTKPAEPGKVHELPKPYTVGKNAKLSSPSYQEQIAGALKIQDRKKSQEQTEEDAQETARVVQEVDKTEVTNNALLAKDDHISVTEPSGFEKILKWWFATENGVYNVKQITEVDTISGPEINTKDKKETQGPGIKTKDKKETKVSAHGNGSATSSAFATCGGSVNTAHKFADSSKASVDNSTQASSLFNKISSWFRSWRSLEETDDGSSDKFQKADFSGHSLFSKDSFWNDMKSFLVTPKGSSLVLQAKTKSQMGQALQKDGPSKLQSLSDDDLHQLVDMLISEKKWVEESAFLSSPFKLSEIVSKDAQGGDASSVNASSSVVSSSLRKHQLTGEKKGQDLPHAVVTQPAKEKLGGKSKSELLGDCKNLVQFIMKENPEGFNIALFRKLFVERFGYPLELNKLGYTKLTTLLHTMPGIRVEASHIMPSGKGLHASGREDRVEPSDKLSDERQKDVDRESPWEEPGPLAAAVSDEKTTKSKKEDLKKIKGQVQHQYEPLSEDDSSAACRSGKPSGTDISSYGRQKKPAKSYSFVADPPPDEKDELIDGTLSSLKKSSDRRSY